jgi:carbonic anhydrase/acetyltransferase-like protein (isoleucine patch superfamily)
VGTITAGQIAANTITSNNIAAGTITTNNFTANTIQGNIIAAGTITATQLAANAITANTVVSTGAVLNNNASLGFWLDGPSGNARFGNSISIGNQLTVGTGANIGASLIVGINASIGANLIVGTNANVGANLRVGNNANIGGNLFVSGLISSGGLIANTVSTTTVVQQAITNTSAVQVGNVTITSNAAQNTRYTYPGPTITTVNAAQPVIIWAQGGLRFQVTLTGPGGSFAIGNFYSLLVRYPVGSPASLTELDVIRSTYSFGVGTSSYLIPNNPFPTYLDNPATTGNYVYAWGAYYTITSQSGTITNATFIVTEETSVSGINNVNNIVALGTKR